MTERREKVRSGPGAAAASAGRLRRWWRGRRSKRPRKTLWQSTRETLDSILVALVLASIFRTFVMEAFEIPTGSMAPTLFGRHVDVTCRACGYSFSVGVDREASAAAPRDIACPMCGTVYAIVDEPTDWPTAIYHRDLTAIGGDRILVDKGVYTLGDPRRWDVGVFVNPHDEKENYIKRVVGLPGDEILIRNGDVYIDGQIARKPDQVQEALWLPVFDSAFVPNGSWADPWPDVPDVGQVSEHVSGGSWRPPWRRVDPVGTWDLDQPVFTYTPATGDTRPSTIRFQWSIFDTYGYGQRTRRGGAVEGYDVDEPRRVGDVRLRADVTLDGPGVVLATIIEDRRQIDFALSADPDRPSSITLDGEGEAASQIAAPLLTPGRRHTIAFVNVDDRAWVELDGRRPLRIVPYDPGPVPSGADGRGRKAIFLGAAGAKVAFADLCIDRDIYYTATTDPETAFGVGRPYTLKEGEYFVLGDNSPSSKDSRRWPGSPIVTREHFIGKALVLYWPHREKLGRIKLVR